MTPFQKSAAQVFRLSETKQARNRLNLPWYDFMSVTAAMPVPAQSWGPDTTWTPTLSLVSPSGAPDYYTYGTPPELTNPLYNRAFYYRKFEIIENWGTDDSGAALSKTTTNQTYPYYANPANPTAGSPDTDPSHDLRLIGWPSDADATSTTTETGTFISTGRPAPSASDLSGMLNQAADSGYPDGLPLPSPLFVTGSDWISVTIPFKGGNLGPGAPYLIQSRTYKWSQKRLVSDLMAELRAMLDSVDLTPKQSIHTREGWLSFDFFRTSGTYHEQNIVPAGAHYDGSGNYTLTVTADQFYGITCGANENAVGGSPDLLDANSTTFIWGGDAGDSAYPYHWFSDGITNPLTERVRPPFFRGGYNVYNSAYSAGIKDCTTFCSHTGSVVLHGTPGALVTAIVSPAHTNKLFLFPLKPIAGGTEYSIWATAQSSAGVLYPAYNGPNYPGGGSGYINNITYGLFMMKSRIRIPTNFISDPPDVSDFGTITTGHGPGVNISMMKIDVGDNSAQHAVAYMTLATGEWIFTPSDITSDTGFGHLFFGTP